MKKIVFLVIFFSLLTGDASLAQELLRHNNFDGNWKFHLGDIPGAEQLKFDDSKWRILDLPHDWSIEGDFDEKAATTGRGGYLPTGIGWYRKTFDLPKQSSDKNISIEFDGIYMNSEVWFNGHYLGKHPNGYVSFYYDLTPYVKKKKNILVVKVDNSLQPNSRWYSGSGIYRHVWLNVANPLHVAQWGTYVTTTLIDSSKAIVTVRVTINNAYKVPKKASLFSLITYGYGSKDTSSRTTFTINPGESKEITQTIQMESPTLWSDGSRFLYPLRTWIYMDNHVVDQYVTKFGIRDIRFDAVNGFLLNGKKVKLNGVCLHHDAGSVGAAVPIEVWRRRLKLLRDMGCNAIRTSHNPMSPEFMDLCDEMGFLVMDEIFDEWTQGKVEFGSNKYFKEWSQKDLVDFIHRDRNHPSVLMWSAGNEIGEQSIDKGD